MSAKNPAEYALYRGDTFLLIGTAEECARELGCKTDFIRWLATPAGRRRFEARQDKSKALTALKMPKEVEEYESVGSI